MQRMDGFDGTQGCIIQRFFSPTGLQGCQMVYFNTKNPNLGIFWRVVEWKMLEYFVNIVNILQQLGIV
jgi:hypothetical protein